MPRAASDGRRTYSLTPSVGGQQRHLAGYVENKHLEHHLQTLASHCFRSTPGLQGNHLLRVQDPEERAPHIDRSVVTSCRDIVVACPLARAGETVSGSAARRVRIESENDRVAIPLAGNHKVPLLSPDQGYSTHNAGTLHLLTIPLS